jgi:hypothetical protein
VSIAVDIAGLIVVAEVEVDDTSEPDCYPNCSGMAVSGAPDEYHDELREIAEACFEVACDGGRKAVDAVNARMMAAYRAEAA